MFGFSMVQFTRRNAHKLDKQLRYKLIHLYRPFRWTPCFLHRPLEGMLKKRKKFPVIIEFDRKKESFNSGLKQVISLSQGLKKCKFKYKYPSISACSAQLTAQAIERLLADSSQIKKIHLDQKVTALLDVASPSIHAEQINEHGLTGKDVGVAVIDTGIEPHPDLTNPEDRIVYFKDFVNQKTSPYDDNGHGTHCAGDVAGNGFASGGKFRGPAPEARLIGVKVLSRTGSGSLSNVMAGVEWCIQNRSSHHIDMISLSLGAQANESCDDPLVQLVEEAWDSGIVVCAAAGNAGPDKQTISSPGVSPKIITVGAMDDKNTTDRSDDEVAEFSSRGPACNNVMKPDLLTPGVNIISLRAKGSFLDKTMKSNRVGDQYFSLSGTSMATPICAGAAALILEQNPEYSPDMVKQKLLEGAVDQGYPSYIQGEGYLDLTKTIQV